MRAIFIISSIFAICQAIPTMNVSNINSLYRVHFMDHYFRYFYRGYTKKCDHNCKHLIQLCETGNKCDSYYLENANSSDFQNQTFYEQFHNAILDMDTFVPPPKGCIKNTNCKRGEYCVREENGDQRCMQIPKCPGTNTTGKLDYANEKCTSSDACPAGWICTELRVGMFGKNQVCCEDMTPPLPTNTTTTVKPPTSEQPRSTNAFYCTSDQCCSGYFEKATKLCPDNFIAVGALRRCESNNKCGQDSGICVDGYCCSPYDATNMVIGRKSFYTAVECKEDCPLPNVYYMYCSPGSKTYVFLGTMDIVRNATAAICNINADCPEDEACIRTISNGTPMTQCHPIPVNKYIEEVKNSTNLLQAEKEVTDKKVKIYIPLYLAVFAILWLFIIMSVMKRGL